MLFFPVYHIVMLISTLFCVTIAYISEHTWNGLSMVLFGLSSHIGASLICSSAPKIPHYYTHFRSKNFVGKKNAQIQGKSAVHPIGLTSILTQYMGIFLRENRVRMCTLWLSNRRSNTVRFRTFLFPCSIAFINHTAYFKWRNDKNGKFNIFKACGVRPPVA